MADDEVSRTVGNNEANEKVEELDASIEADIKKPQDPDIMNIDGANDANADLDAELSGFAARIPAKKDASLREFIGKMDEFAPIVSLSYPTALAPNLACDFLITTEACSDRR